MTLPARAGRALALAAGIVAGLTLPVRGAEEARAHWGVTTADPRAQDLFDRGLAMMYAFDIGEARVAFEQAAQRDPGLAMAYWGMAEADTIDINRPSTPEGERRGVEAVAQARSRLAHASAEERLLVDAIAKRYAKGTEKQKFSRYADAMSVFAKAHRDEPNALVVTGFAIYTAEDALLDGKDALTPKAREIQEDADRALELEPTNLGAHHLRIHLLENAHRSNQAVPDADALSSYTYPPGESHLPHMAGHIWSRTGEYERLVADNQHAVDNDRAWFALGDGPGQQYMKLYHAHDVDFVSYGLTTLGRNDEARAAVKGEDTLSQLKTALRLHDDARVMELARNSSSGFNAFAGAVAAGRRGDAPAARATRAKLAGDGASGVRVALIDAAIALGEHDPAARAAAYARAYGLTKSDFPGDPKDYWPTPIGEGYAAALLAASKAADSETVFGAELKRFPNDPHLEFGLAEALKAQGKDDTAPRAAYKAHWKGTRDLTLADLG
jgi:tetratricopeptide (TPR) repeat protein